MHAHTHTHIHAKQIHVTRIHIHDGLFTNIHNITIKYNNVSLYSLYNINITYKYICVLSIEISFSFAPAIDIVFKCLMLIKVNSIHRMNYLLVTNTHSTARE